MPRNYTRKTTWGQTPLREMESAAAEVMEGQKSLREAGRDRNIDKTTLQRFIKKKQKGEAKSVAWSSVAEAKRIFTVEMEEDLAKRMKDLADQFHGLAPVKCRELAYEYAERNNIPIPTSWTEKKCAGKDWFSSFLARCHLSVRTPEATSRLRATAFNKTTVGEFFDNLAAVMDRHTFPPHMIYNADETGVFTVQKPRQIVTEKGKRQVGELVTVVCAVNAAGNAIPPMMIFPRVRFKEELMTGAPPGAKGASTKTGWMNEDTWPEFLEHLMMHTQCTPDHPMLLILDNLKAHISLKAVEKAKSSGIVLLTLPPHTSHRMQPLDVTVHGPFKSLYSRALDGWMRSNPGKTVSIYQIAGLVNEAFLSAMTPRNITSGFRSTGIFPYNRDIFPEEAFAPSAVSDRPNPELQPASTGPSTSDDPYQPYPADEPLTDASPSTSRGPHGCASPADSDLPRVPTQPGYVSPCEILPLPKCPPRAQTKRKRVKTAILANTPEKPAIEMAHEERQKKMARKKQNRRGKPTKQAPKKKILDSSYLTIPLEDEFESTDNERSDLDNTDLNVGDFVLVNFATKRRCLRYVGMVEKVENDEILTQFLRRIQGNKEWERPTFAIKENDVAHVPKVDVLKKLPQPKRAGGTTRRDKLLSFPCNMQGWNVE